MFLGYAIVFRHSPDAVVRFCERAGIDVEVEWDPHHGMAGDLARARAVDSHPEAGSEPLLRYRGLDRCPLCPLDLEELLPDACDLARAAHEDQIFYDVASIEAHRRLSEAYPRLFDIVGVTLHASENVEAATAVGPRKPSLPSTSLGFDVIISETFESYVHSCIPILGRILSSFLARLNDCFLFSDLEAAKSYLSAYKRNEIREFGPLSIVEVSRPLL